VRNGHYADGRQRWFCRTCRRSFSWRNPTARSVREREWFRRWIVEGYSVRQLALQSGHSSRKLYRLTGRFLTERPPEPVLDTHSARHLIFDGTFLHRPRSIAVLMDGQTHMVIRGQYDVSENSERRLRSFFEPLVRQGLDPSSFTVDGNPHVIKVLGSLWPEAVIQRCMVHIQRQGLMWCRAKPKTEHARQLREIFLQVTGIRTAAERGAFLGLVDKWEDRHGREIRNHQERGRVFSDIKRARSMLLKALPHMFHYLDDPHIPNTTNGLEGYFSRLKSHYRQHRGLHPENLTNYFAWYFHLVPR
jgi:hypothetical protein